MIMTLIHNTKNNSMKVIILGKGDMLANLIEGTLDAGSDIVGVFRYERTAFNFLHLKLHDFFKPSNDLTVIKQHKLHEIKCKSANSEQFKKEVLKLNADVILVGTWKEKLNKEITDLPVIASINVHPSYLPKYRGPNPYLQTILNGETSSGITFHLMDKKFDSGAILAQKPINILPNDTSKELRERTVFQARLMCQEVLKKLEYGLIIPVNQKENEASYYKNIQPIDIMLDFKKESSNKIHARIRALHPWLPAYFRHENKFFIPNPYKIKILTEKETQNILSKNNIKFPKPAEIIDKNVKLRSITIMCNDKKSLKMDDVKLYGFFNKLFTKSYIQNINI